MPVWLCRTSPRTTSNSSCTAWPPMRFWQSAPIQISMLYSHVSRGEILGPHDPGLAVQDFAKDDVKQFRRSLAFYEGLAGRLGAAGHCLDVFACSLDQVGLAEMHPAVVSTGESKRMCQSIYVTRSLKETGVT